MAGLRQPARPRPLRCLVPADPRQRLPGPARRGRVTGSWMSVGSWPRRTTRVVRDASEATAARDALDRALAGLDADHQVVVALRFHAD